MKEGFNMKKEIFDEQCELVDNYITFYEPQFMGARKYLKEYYFKASIIETLLGEEMYKEISNFTINESGDKIAFLIEQLIDESKFVSHYAEAVHDYMITREKEFDMETFNQMKHLLYSFININTLANNSSELKDDICINGVDIQIKEGMKVMRALRKIAEALQLDMAEFEKFRKEHAKILSTKSLTGTLCLSALPMDYLTLSDNNSNWSSCYSWRKTGVYHASTLAYLNATNTIVAYLKSDDEYNWSGNKTWNNKMWRQLIYVDSDFIIPGKAYPYENESLTKQIAQWIVSLLPQNNGTFVETKAKYENNSLYLSNSPIVVSVSNRFAYNDFYGEFPVYIRQGIFNTALQQIIFDGKAHCLDCGTVIEAGFGQSQNAVVLRICTDCREPKICSYCGGIIYPEEFYLSDIDDGEEALYHYDCYSEYITIEEGENLYGDK